MQSEWPPLSCQYAQDPEKGPAVWSKDVTKRQRLVRHISQEKLSWLAGWLKRLQEAATIARHLNGFG